MTSMVMMHPGQQFSPNGPHATLDALTGSKRALCEAARTVRGSDCYKAMLRGIGECEPWGETIGALCEPVGSMLLDLMPKAQASAGVKGIIRHATRTRDAKELARVVENLAEKGALA